MANSINDKSGILLDTPFKLVSQQPLDVRYVLTTKQRENLTADGGCYSGLEVWDSDENKKYRAVPTADGFEWKELKADSIDASTLQSHPADDFLLKTGGTMTGPVTIGKGDGRGILFGDRTSNININENSQTKTILGFLNNKFTINHHTIPLLLRGNGIEIRSQTQGDVLGAILMSADKDVTIHSGGVIKFDCPGNSDFVFEGKSASQDYSVIKSGTTDRVLFLQPNKSGYINIGDEPKATAAQDKSARLIVQDTIKIKTDDTHHTKFTPDTIVKQQDNTSYTLTTPNKTGTIALTSDIPTIPTVAIGTISNVDPMSETVNVISEIKPDGHTLNLHTFTVPTKQYVDKLVNPTMEFKGVIYPTTIGDLPSTGVKKGDTYKIGSEFTYTINKTTKIAKIGDVIIALKDQPSAAIDDSTQWALIPAGDVDTDTWRAIKVDNTNILTSGISSGTVNFKHGDNITLTATANNGDITIAADDTKNTTGSTQSTEKLYIVGATAQQDNIVTHTNEDFYFQSSGLYINDSADTSVVKHNNIAADKLSIYELSAQYYGSTDYKIKTIEHTEDGATHILTIPNKTGTIATTNDIPTVYNNTITITAGNGLTTGGNFTLNQNSDKTITLNVGAGTGITAGTDNISVKDYDNLLTAQGSSLKTENGTTIILDCGGAPI